MKVQELRNWEKLKNSELHFWVSCDGRTKTISKEPVFLGRLFSAPLRRYIFHRVSTKRGRSIFYHKGLWTQSHMYAGQHTRTHTRISSIVSTLGWSVTSPGSAEVPQGEKEATEKARRPSIVSPRRGRLIEEKKKPENVFIKENNTKDKLCRQALAYLFVITCCILSQSLVSWEYNIKTANLKHCERMNSHHAKRWQFDDKFF